MSNARTTTGRLSIVAGLLTISTLCLAAPAHAASFGHHAGMTAGPLIGPAVQLPAGRTHGHEGPRYAPPYAYGGGPTNHHRPHHYDPNWKPDGPMTATTTKLKPR
jgi:hypothetical protein